MASFEREQTGTIHMHGCMYVCSTCNDTVYSKVTIASPPICLHCMQRLDICSCFVFLNWCGLVSMRPVLMYHTLVSGGVKRERGSARIFQFISLQHWYSHSHVKWKCEMTMQFSGEHGQWEMCHTRGDAADKYAGRLRLTSATESSCC